MSVVAVPFTLSRRRRAPTALAAAALLLAASPALRAQQQPMQLEPRASSVPMSATLGFEKVKLPAGEKMGLAGASILFETSPGWWFGPAVYGAATGLRGGFFVGGIEGQRRWMLGDNVGLIAGLYAGGGGGGAAPVGGGLMLRPAVSLMAGIGHGLQAGISFSSVRFPNGDINSRQLGLLLAWNGDFRYYDASDAGRRVNDDKRSGFGIDRVVGTLNAYQYKDAGNKRIGLLGARVEQTYPSSDNDAWHAGFEAAAAGQGGAAGYMEILGSLAYERAVFPQALPKLTLGVRGAAGLGGGGSMPSGGGVLVKGMLTAGWEFTPRWQLGVEAGFGRGHHGHPNSRIAQVWLATTMERGAGTGAAPRGDADVVRMDWAATLHHFTRVKRNDGTTRSLELVGIKLDREVSDKFYLTAQAHSAYAGGAGAYSVGLLGMGVATPYVKKGWRAGAELLAGAAGGGGVSTGGGAIGQTVAWTGWSTGHGGQVRVGVGAVRSLRGSNLSSPLVEVGWSQSFGVLGR